MSSLGSRSRSTATTLKERARRVLGGRLAEAAARGRVASRPLAQKPEPTLEQRQAIRSIQGDIQGVRSREAPNGFYADKYERADFPKAKAREISTLQSELRRYERGDLSEPRMVPAPANEHPKAAVARTENNYTRYKAWVAASQPTNYDYNSPARIRLRALEAEQTSARHAVYDAAREREQAHSAKVNAAKEGNNSPAHIAARARKAAQADTYRNARQLKIYPKFDYNSNRVNARSPQEHAAEQTTEVRKARARLINADAAVQQARLELRALQAERAAGNEASAAKIAGHTAHLRSLEATSTTRAHEARNALENAYKAAGLKYKAPQTLREKFEAKARNEAAAQRKALTESLKEAAQNTDASRAARTAQLMAAHDYGGKVDAARSAARAEHTARARGTTLGDLPKTAKAAAKEVSAAEAKVQALRQATQSTYQSEWVRLMREEGLADLLPKSAQKAATETTTTAAPKATKSRSSGSTTTRAPKAPSAKAEMTTAAKAPRAKTSTKTSTKTGATSTAPKAPKEPRTPKASTSKSSKKKAA